MLDVLDFVRGSISKKDIVPILKSFHVYDGRIQGTNGRLTIDSPHGITFVVGGDAGLDETVRKRADTLLSLSPMTLPHQLARVVLLEQIYRACTLIRGIRYHK